MKNIKIIRFILQLLFLLATSLSFLMNSKLTIKILLTVSILGGAFYCGWVCPFGFIQDLLDSLGKKLKINNKLTRNQFNKYFKYSRYIILRITLFFSFDFLFNLLSFDPRTNLAIFLKTKDISAINLITLLLFALFSIFNSRFFCKYLCIEGAKHSFLSIFKIFSVKRNEKKCINCKRCDRVCPVNIKVSEEKTVLDLKCTSCFNCIAECPVKNTLSYGGFNYQNRRNKYTKFIAFILLIIVSKSYIYDTLSSFDFFRLEKALTPVIGYSANDEKIIIKDIKKIGTDGTKGKTVENIPVESNKNNLNDTLVLEEKSPKNEIKADEKKIIPISEPQKESVNEIRKLTGTGQGFKGPI